jgi:hypothetical protein
LLGATGVCAGPKQMIEDFLATAVEGAPGSELADHALPAGLTALLDELPAIIDYGLYGLQVWAVMFSTAIAMSVAVQDLLAICEAASDQAGAAWLAARLREDLPQLDDLQIRLAYDREIHQRTFADIYHRAWTGARTSLGPPSLAAAIAPIAETDDHRASAAELRAQLTTALVAAGDDRAASELLAHQLADVWIRYVREAQAALRLIGQLQAAINHQLDRPHATRPLEDRDLFTSFQLYQGVGQFRELADAVDDALGVRVTHTADRIQISARLVDRATA